LIGLLSGFLSGLLGIGGGVITVPAMVFFMGYSQKEAQGTSIFLMLFLGIIGVLGYSLHSVRLDFDLVVTLSVGCLFGALIGSSIAQKINTSSLKKFFALYLIIAGFRILLL
jgi:uncharacterized protein